MAGRFWITAVLVSTTVGTITPNRALITPAPTLIQRQVGIDPVSVNLGKPDNYILSNLGPHNPVLTYDGTVYHYIEKHTGYLSLATNTVNGQVTTSSVKAATVTPIAGGTGQGIAFSEDVANGLRKTVDAAKLACGLAKRSLGRRTDTMTCLIDQASQLSDTGGPLEGVEADAFWENLAVDVAKNAPEYIGRVAAVIASQARKKKFLIILAAIIVEETIKEGPIAAVNIPENGVGADKPSSTCDPSKPVTKNSPLCRSGDCLGNIEIERCTVGKDKDCPCLVEGMDTEQQGEQSWWGEQQKIIGAVDANHGLLDSAPSCSINSGGDGFDGKPAATPASWCVCMNGNENRIYPTLSTPSFPCAYTTTPTATVSIRYTLSTGQSVTSCRTATITGSGPGSGPYCTCNDNFMYGIATWTDGGSVVTGCTATRKTQKPTPTKEAPPKCFPNLLSETWWCSHGDTGVSTNKPPPE